LKIHLQPVTDLSVTGCFFNKQILSVYPLLSQFSYPLQYFDGNICNIAYLLIYPVYGIIFLSSNNLTIDSSLLFKKNCATIRKEEHEKMADKDAVTKEYMQDNEIFADAFNFYIYDGEQIIDPKKLRPLDTAAIALPFGDNTGIRPIQKYRDVIKLLTAMTDDHATYVVYGIEVQSKKHFAMPVRNMLYDALQYSGQVEKTARDHRKNKDKTDSSDEFLSGFYRTDKLIPVVTLVIYFGADKWDAPKSVYDMFSVIDKRILKYTQDYRINLIEPAAIPDEDFAKLKTELSQVFKYIKYSSDMKRLSEIIEEDDAYKSISRRTANMINTVTNSNIEIDNGKETFNMCEAIEGIRNEGERIGIIKGERQGIIKGEIEGARKANIETAKKIIALGKLSFDEIAAICNLTPEEVGELAREV